LTTPTDALRATTGFTYGCSSDSDLYTHAYDSIFPLANIHLPLVLVSTMTKNDGLTGIHSTSYRYAELRAHLQGKGLLGFMDIAARDNLTGVTTQNGKSLFLHVLQPGTAVEVPLPKKPRGVFSIDGRQYTLGWNYDRRRKVLTVPLPETLPQDDYVIEVVR
jgi:hypothetical protein